MDGASLFTLMGERHLGHSSFILGRFYKLALTDCETIFEVNLFVSEGV